MQTLLSIEKIRLQQNCADFAEGAKYLTGDKQSDTLPLYNGNGEGRVEHYEDISEIKLLKKQ